MNRELVIGGIFLIVVLAVVIFVMNVGEQTSNESKITLTSTEEDSNLPQTKEPELDSVVPEKREQSVSESIISPVTESTVAETVNLPAEDEYWIVGYVRDENGKPLPGSKVVAHVMDGKDERMRITEDEGNAGIAMTNDEGYYTILADGPHEFQLRSEPPENHLTLVERVPFPENEKTLTHHFNHPSAAFKVRGKVIDKQTKEPIEGANVVLLPKLRKMVHEKQRSVKATSNEKGRFVLHRVAAGIFRLQASAEGYVDVMSYGRSSGESHPLSSIDVNEKTQDKEYIIEMEPGWAALVSVKDENGVPVAEAHISFIRDANLFSYVTAGSTDVQGQCLIQKLPREKLIAQVKKESSGSAISSPFEPGPVENPTQVEVILTAAGSVSGVVTDSDGNPLPGKHVYANFQSAGDWANLPNEQAETDDSGHYVIDNLSAGNYQISLSHQGHPLRVEQSKAIELQAGDAKTGVDFQLGKMARLRGKVVNEEDEPLVDIFVHAVTYKTGGELVGSGTTRTDDKGEFLVPDAPFGDEIQFQLQGDGYAHTIIRHQLDIERYYVLTMKSCGTIQGVVVDQNQQPVAGAKVYPIRVWSHGSTYPLTMNTVMTDSDGSFELKDLDPMEYKLCTQAEGFTRKEGPNVVLHKGETADSVVVELEPGEELSGIVVDHFGQPVTDALISIHSYVANRQGSGYSSSFRAQEFPEAARSDGEGKFVVTDFPPSGDILIVQHDQFAPGMFEVTPSMLGQPPMNYSLSPGGVVEGTVFDSDNHPMSNAQIQIQNYPENLFRYQEITDQNGEYRIEHLSPMSYMVLKSDPNGDHNSIEYKTIMVEEGQTVRADFGSGEGTTIHGVVLKRGAPVANARIALDSQNITQKSIGVYLHTISADDGSYSIQSVPEGNYYLLASTEQKGRIHQSNAEYNEKIQIAEEQTEMVHDINLAALEIQGTVVDAESGEALAGVSIQPVIPTDTEPQKGYYQLRETTDDAGTFLLYPQEGGEYRFVAMKDGYGRKEFSVSVPALPPGQFAPPVQVTVEMTKDETSLIVHLFFDGQPASTSWAHIRVRNENLRERLAETQLPEPGSYRVSGMPEGEFTLEITAYCDGKVKSTLPQTLSVRRGETQEISLDLFETKTYAITLVHPSEEEINASATIEILDFPQIRPIQTQVRNIPERNIKNTIYETLPSGYHRFRLTIPGFQPIEFDPEALAPVDKEEETRKITLTLTLL